MSICHRAQKPCGNFLTAPGIPLSRKESPMSKLESGTQYSVHQGLIRRDRAGNGTWRQILHHAVHQSTWIGRAKKRPESNNESMSPSSSSRSGSKWTAPIFFGVIVLLSVPIAFAVMRLLDQPAHLKQSPSAIATSKTLLGMNSQATAKPKPAPGKPFVPVEQTHFTNPTVWTPAPSSQPASNATVVPQNPVHPAFNTPAPPQVANVPQPQPVAPAKPAFAPLVYPAHHDKHFGGCTGQLTLDAAGLNFRCAEDSSGSFQVALREIGAIDENGIQTLSGKKYHFSISGMSKPAAQQLFANWLHQVR